ncbi:MAG TPA: type II toxin-antitoxin system HicA family toxin [Chloroflexi bacterium]|nr:type II toxin-antitoxin system HicA family toxin [Chloroflexota bacterium]
MKYKEVTRRLRSLGCEFKRQADGSHEIWWHPGKRKFTVIPRHGGRDIPKGTLRAILRQLDIDPDEFYKRGKKR